jgi:hypothetical protein
MRAIAAGDIKDVYVGDMWTRPFVNPFAQLPEEIIPFAKHCPLSLFSHHTFIVPI